MNKRLITAVSGLLALLLFSSNALGKKSSGPIAFLGVYVPDVSETEMRLVRDTVYRDLTKKGYSLISVMEMERLFPQDDLKKNLLKNRHAFKQASVIDVSSVVVRGRMYRNKRTGEWFLLLESFDSGKDKFTSKKYTMKRYPSLLRQAQEISLYVERFVKDLIDKYNNLKN